MADKKAKAEAPLGEVAEFFIKNHLHLNDKELVRLTGATTKQVRGFRDSQPAPESMLNQTLHKPRTGIVAMTGEASTIAEDLARKGNISQDMIDRAIGNKDFQLAEQLTKLRATQQRDLETEQRAMNAGRFHYIER